MTIKQIEQASKIYEQVKELDKEIVGIEKLAEAIINRDSGVSLEMKSERPKEDQKKKILNEDGSLVDNDKPKEHSFFTMFSPRDYVDQSNNIITDSLDVEISINEALMILEVLINTKSAQRVFLMSQLESISK